jgi:hypothetical protein
VNGTGARRDWDAAAGTLQIGVTPPVKRKLRHKTGGGGLQDAWNIVEWQGQRRLSQWVAGGTTVTAGAGGGGGGGAAPSVGGKDPLYRLRHMISS